MAADIPMEMQNARNTQKAQKVKQMQNEPDPVDTDILIIGGGLSGLALARHLTETGRDWRLLEARGRWGGRILSETPLITSTERRSGSSDVAAYDLGPAWFWPGQPRIDRLIQAFGLRRFDQAHEGAQIFEDAQGGIHHGRGMASMQGAFRIEGGFSALIAALAGSLLEDRLYLNHPVETLRKAGPSVEAITRAGRVFRARQLVLSLPPRIAAGFKFEPALPGTTIQAAQHIPTWMAGHAKAVARYDRPFWRDAGWSGDAQSQRGPLMEIHDASPFSGPPSGPASRPPSAGPLEGGATGKEAALFGFIGTSPDLRERYRPKLKEAIIDQLGRIFGPHAAQPSALMIKDWAFSEWTATALDRQPLYAHPSYGRPAALGGLWEDRLHFAGSEMAMSFGGFLEGALEAAEDMARFLHPPTKTSRASTCPSNTRAVSTPIAEPPMINALGTHQTVT